eukprot:5505932-Heterocapsa_arctica.AAC.1
MRFENNDIISMLEVIDSNFPYLKTNTKSAEASVQMEYGNFTTNSKVDQEGMATKSKKEKYAEHMQFTIYD